MAEIFEINKQIHFIGIGGIGMSGIAKILLGCGRKVSGSDLKQDFVIEELRTLGACIYKGHAASNLKDAQAVVYSSAIEENNPEIIEAMRLNIPILKRAQALLWLMQGKTPVTVTGSHGKTTTSSLAFYLLSEAGFFPTAVIGGVLLNTNNNAVVGRGSFFVAEADESDGSFLYYQPKFSIITNIDYEHLDYYRDIDNEIETFRQFIGKTEDGGCVFYCKQDINLKNIMQGYKNKCVSFGLSQDADIYPKNVRIGRMSCSFDCFAKNKGFIGKFYLGLSGVHNVSNSLSIIALGLELGIDIETIKKALAGFKGARRRIEVKFEDKDYTVVDDYAHHPSEIKATLTAVKDWGARRIISVFQPHRYTRTKLLMDEFAKSFGAADYIIITDIYSAGEVPLEGIDAKRIYEKIKANAPDKEVKFLPRQDLVSYITEILMPSDLVITLGAGDITRICDELVQELKIKR